MDAPLEERLKHANKLIGEDEDFLFAVTTRAATKQRKDETTPDRSLELDDDLFVDTKLDVDNENGPLVDLYVDKDKHTQTTDNGSSDEIIMIPDLESTDYEYDDEFGPMYKYLMTGDLSEDEAINKTIFLTHEQFILQNSKLYKIETPRRKNLAKLVPVRKRLCVPLKFRFVILQQMHDNAGHFSIDKMFLAISSRFYWKTIYGDVQAYVKSCETCMCTKPNYAQKAVPLHPIEPAYFPGEVISISKFLVEKLKRET